MRFDFFEYISNEYRMGNQQKVASLLTDDKGLYVVNDDSVAGFRLYFIHDDELEDRIEVTAGGQQPSYTTDKLSPGDALLLCSEGVWSYLQDQEVLFDMMKSHNAREWTRTLLLRIIDRLPDSHAGQSMTCVMVG